MLALVLDKPGQTGPKLKPHDDVVPCDVLPKVTGDVFVLPCGPLLAVDRPNNSILSGGRDFTMDQIAWYLTSFPGIDHPVVAQTGLSGRFDFTLQFTRETNAVTPDPGTTMNFTKREAQNSRTAARHGFWTGIAQSVHIAALLLD